MYERFTDRARTVMQLAKRVAQSFFQEYIGTEHVLLAILWEGSGVGANALRNLNIHWDKLQQEIAKIVQPGEHRWSNRERLPLTPRVKQVIAYAVEESELLDVNYVGTAHLLLGMVGEREGVGAQVLENIGVKAEDVRGEVLRLLGREIPVEKVSNIPPSPKPVQPSTETDKLVVMEKEAMFQRFTDRARKVMQLANQEAQHFNHEYIGSEHILLGLVKEGSGVAAHVLKNLEIDVGKLRREVEKIIQPGPDKVTMGKLPQTPKAKKVIEYSIEEARNHNHNYVGTEHLLLGLLREQEGVAAQVLMNLGLKLEDIREEVISLLSPKQVKRSRARMAGLWTRRWLLRVRDPLSPKMAKAESGSSQALEENNPCAIAKRIRSLEQQLRILRFQLGGMIGAVIGALLYGGTGAFRGWVVGAIIVLFGEIPAALAGGISGVLLAAAYLPHVIEWVLAGLLGASAGMILAEMGKSPGSRSIREFWRRR